MNVRSPLSSGALAIGLLLSLVRPARATPDVLFREGIEAYRAANYSQAAVQFGAATRLQPSSGALQNLGLAEWQRGHTGEAILAWEQARWLDPFNHAAEGNLKYVRRLAQLEAPDLAWYEAVSSALPMNWWVWIAAISFWIAIAAIMVPGIFRRRRTATYQAIAAVGLMIFLLTVIAQLGIQTRSRLGFVLEKDSVLRLTPTQEAQAIARLQPGEPVRLKKTRGQYMLVRSNRTVGWVKKGELGYLISK